MKVNQNMSVFSRIVQFLKNLKKEDYIVIVLAGVLFLIISLPVKDETKVLESQSNRTQEIDDKTNRTKEKSIDNEIDINNICYDADEYTAYLETKLENILQSMDGAGAVNVMITVSSTQEKVPLKDIPETSSDISEQDSAGGSRITMEKSNQESTIFEEAASGENTPYIVKINMPEITGVLISAQGAGNAVVKKNIIEAVEVLFQINEHKIKVIRMKS